VREPDDPFRKGLRGCRFVCGDEHRAATKAGLRLDDARDQDLGTSATSPGDGTGRADARIRRRRACFTCDSGRSLTTDMGRPSSTATGHLSPARRRILQGIKTCLPRTLGVASARRRAPQRSGRAAPATSGLSITTARRLTGQAGSLLLRDDAVAAKCRRSPSASSTRTYSVGRTEKGRPATDDKCPGAEHNDPVAAMRMRPINADHRRESCS
jgi:hypothetical protein